MRILTSLAAAVSLLPVLLSGCGSHDAGPANPAPVRKAVKPADALARNLVAAVASVKPGTPPIPVQVKFALREHPQAAQPAEIELAIIPASAALDRVFGKIQGEEGLTVVEGEDVPETLKPSDTVPIHHSFKVESKQDGIYELTVNVSVDSGGQLSTQSYSIPVIIGNGMEDLPAPGTAAPPAVAAKPPATAPAGSPSH